MGNPYYVCFIFCRSKCEIAHQLLLKLYLRIPGMIQHLVDVELDKFLAKACVTGMYILCLFAGIICKLKFLRPLNKSEE